MNQEGTHGEHVPAIVAAAHELKAPLALVRQQLLRLDSSDVSSAQQRLIQQAVMTTERGLRLTSNLTRAARIEEGALFTLEPINPEQMCRDIATELAPLFEAHGRTLQVHQRKHPLLLVANRDLLRRILLGFSDNALHYSEPGSPVHMQITALKQAGVVRVGVRDYGPALSSDLWKTLQKKMKLAPQPVHARPESSGLGLMLAQQFAEAMNGEIGVVRHKDGATFYVDLQASTQLSFLS
ncbi:HAMP domain-containing histidine kinase [Candidatus Saccharibacteria bacterium TM7i]|nr:HAMP domain-containing histidine kinase [Candidatus Saccharibacteria bacterium TM7i]